MDWLNPWVLFAILGGVGFLYLVWHFFEIGHTIRSEKARVLFGLQHERLEHLFLKAAEATGKPRGLRWLSCTFAGELVLARWIAQRKLLGLVPVIVRFAAIPDGDMEGLPAVNEDRHGCAVFVFEHGDWHTEGRVIFNLDPAQAIAQFPGCEMIHDVHQI